MKNKLLKTMFMALTLFILPILVSASNESPTVKSEIVKDGSLDFNVTLSDMELETSVEYEWGIVANQAASVTTWNAINEWTANGTTIYLKFSKDDVYNVLSKVDTAYLVIREKTSQTIVSDHIAVDVSVPYAYGAVPKYDSEHNDWYRNEIFKTTISGREARKYTAVKITDKNIINGYFNLKKNGEITQSDLAEYVDSLHLNEAEIPSTFLTVSNGDAYSMYDRPGNKRIGITEEVLYLVWGATSYGSSKTIYGVTIYDNGYKEGSTSNTPTNNKNEDVVIPNETDKNLSAKPTSNTTENPKTGIETYSIIGIVAIVLFSLVYIVLRKKNKFNRV